MSHMARFSIIPGWIVTDPRLKGNDLRVLCLLGRHTDKHGWCRRSQVKMAAQLNCARSTVQASLDRLGELGVVEKHVEESRDGRDSAHSYRVIYDAPPPEGYAFSAWDEADGEEENPIPTLSGETPPAGIPAPPADPESAPPAGPGSAPINDPSLTIPSERRERERAGAKDHHGTEGGNAGGPVNAELIKRVQKFCTGEGYSEGAWPKWGSSTIGYIAREFAKLSDEERDEACRWRDCFLAKCKRERITKPMPVGNYFRDRVWDMLTDKDRHLGQTAAVAGRPVGADGRIVVPVFGPAWASARMLAVLRRPRAVEIPDDIRERKQETFDTLRRASISRAESWAMRVGLEFDEAGQLLFPEGFERAEASRRIAEEGYPEANRLIEAARDRNHVSVEAVFERLKDLCEAVPVGSDMWKAWQAWHVQNNKPFVPEPKAMKVVYFPKGGPHRIDEFQLAAERALSDAQARMSDDAA